MRGIEAEKRNMTKKNRILTLTYTYETNREKILVAFDIKAEVLFCELNTFPPIQKKIVFFP